MNARTFALIFFAWAVLAIITPTLILLSASSQLEDSDGLLAEVVTLRRSQIPLHPKNATALLTYTSETGITAYGGNLGFWDFISTLTGLPRKLDSQLLDDPWEGHHTV
ncbi:unnamed protein product [Rhodiola kirilowii]